MERGSVLCHDRVAFVAERTSAVEQRWRTWGLALREPPFADVPHLRTPVPLLLRRLQHPYRTTIAFVKRAGDELDWDSIGGELMKWKELVVHEAQRLRSHEVLIDLYRR